MSVLIFNKNFGGKDVKWKYTDLKRELWKGYNDNFSSKIVRQLVTTVSIKDLFDLIWSSNMYITQHLAHKKTYIKVTSWRVTNCYAIEF